MVAWARSAGAPLASERHQLAEVPVPVDLECLAAPSGREVAYGHIYVRDRYRCSSPVCNRRDVTPHHLQFRSAGGSDDDDNVAAVCTWCHLFGVHGGRIRAEGTAERIHWELGAVDRPCLVVDGRERRAA